MRLVPCRARISSLCHQGDADDDSTFDGKTVVCMACYAEMIPHSPSGKLLMHEIPDTILRVRRMRPPHVFLCLADHVFDGEPTVASDLQTEVLDAQRTR